MLFVVSGCGKKKSKQPDQAGAKSGPQKGNGKKPTENPPAADDIGAELQKESGIHNMDFI
uniref:Lipoprotein n=1 Tax=Ascaris lumbricoides TaxID=6252 RepID=A0A0M3I923_ASCLU